MCEVWPAMERRVRQVIGFNDLWKSHVAEEALDWFRPTR
jgi:hypothetical protein